MDDNDRLLAYMQGRLDEAGAAAFEADVARSPDLQAELAALSAVANVMAKDVPDEAAKDAGWARLSRSIEAEQMRTPANQNRRPSFAQAAGFAVASVVAWQFFAVPFLTGSEDPAFVPVSESTAGPTLRIAFTDDARLADITALLSAAGAVITDGPSAVGLFTLEFPDEAARAEAEALLADRSDLVITVSRP